MDTEEHEKLSKKHGFQVAIEKQNYPIETGTVVLK